MFLSITVIVVGIIVTGFISWRLRKRHLEMRRKERRCVHKDPKTGEKDCSKDTVRLYQMLDYSQGQESRWGRKYHRYILDVCPEGHVKIIDNYWKFFPMYQLAYRHFTDPGQFTIRPELFKLAGLIIDVQPTLAEQIHKAQALADQEAQKMRFLNSEGRTMTATSLNSGSVDSQPPVPVVIPALSQRRSPALIMPRPATRLSHTGELTLELRPRAQRIKK